MKIIDVSYFNGDIDWSKVAKECDGAIIRAGYRGNGSGTLVTDIKFTKNIKGATDAGVPIGVYFVTQAVNAAEAKEEARYAIKLCQGYNLQLPVFIDSENSNIKGTGRADNGKLTRRARTSVLKAFCEEVKKNKLTPGIYTGEWWFNTLLYGAQLEAYYLWIAKYSKTAPNCKYNAWQYTSEGRIDGIKGNVDISTFYNLEVKEEAPKKTIEDIVNEVLDGKWGNGDERKKKLTEAGYNYNEIQQIINDRLSSGKKYYTVKKGDTLSSIANRYSVDINKIIKLNGITNPNLIYPGQRLRIK